MLKHLSQFLRPRAGRRPLSRASKPHRTRLKVEMMEERVTPSWGATPPSYVSPPSTAGAVRLDARGDASGDAAIASSEVDWFKLAAPKSGAYTLATDNSASGVNTVLGVYKSSGYRLAYNDDVSGTNKSSAVTLNLTAGQTYYFGVTNFTGAAGGAYRWSVNGPALEDSFEDNDTQAAATNLGGVAGRRTLTGLGLQDAADWFKFTTTAVGGSGNAVSISFLNTLGNLDLALYNAGGTLLTQKATTYNTESISLSGRAAGTYYVKVFGQGGATNGNYSLTVNAPLADDGFENNDTRLTAHGFGTPTSTGTYSKLALADAADWYKFTTTAAGTSGSSVAIGFSNAAGNLTLKLYSSGGGLLRTSATTNDRETVSLNGMSAGTYYVKVYGAATGVTNPKYTLTITPPASSPTAPAPAPVAPGTTTRGLAESLDKDGSLSRADMLQIFAQVEADGTVSTAEFTDLKAIVTDAATFVMADPVRVLSQKVVLGNPANAKYQGTTLGNLAAGNPASKLVKLVNKWFLGLDHPVADGTYVSAAGTLFGSGPTYQQINQGEANDCYLLAGLGSVALHTPATIRTMFSDNGDGTFVVRFYRGGTPDYVTVDRYLPTRNGRFIYANMGDSATNTGNVLWAALAEKAYAQWNESGIGRSTSANSYSSIEIGEPSESIKHVAGKATYFAWTGDLSFSTIRGRFDANENVTFGTKSSVASNLVPGHAYIMVGYDAAKQTVTLFNPWGTDGGYYSGTLRAGFVTLTMSQLLANFNSCWYS